MFLMFNTSVKIYRSIGYNNYKLNQIQIYRMNTKLIN